MLECFEKTDEIWEKKFEKTDEIWEKKLLTIVHKKHYHFVSSFHPTCSVGIA